MNYLVAWSGGLDSTGLIYDLLSKGHYVSTVYVKIKNNKQQSKKELKAISKMRSYFSQYSFEFRGYQEIQISAIAKPGLHLNQVPILLLGLLYSLNSEFDSKVALGYIMNDDAISYLPEIKRVWKSYSHLLSQSTPPLEFPLIKTKKSEIYQQLPTSLKESITWCESEDQKLSEPCGKCPSCIRMNDLLETT